MTAFLLKGLHLPKLLFIALVFEATKHLNEVNFKAQSYKPKINSSEPYQAYCSIIHQRRKTFRPLSTNWVIIIMIKTKVYSSAIYAQKNVSLENLNFTPHRFEIKGGYIH